MQGSFLVVKDGKPAMSYATANQPDTSYLINSVQKFMTATMIMRAVQQHKLSLDDKLAKFYPTVPGSKKVTIMDLLQMQSGLNLKPNAKLGRKPFISDTDNMHLAEKYTVFIPHMLHKSMYSTVNYVYLSGVISKVEHQSYENVLRETFINKLHLKDTAFIWKNKKLSKMHFVQPYAEKKGKMVKMPLDVDAVRGEQGAGSLVMSNHDLYLAAKATLDGTLLSAKSRSILFTGAAPNTYNGGFYNLPNYKNANGAGAGYITFLRITNDGRDALIAQTNMTTNSNFYQQRALASQAMDTIIG